VLQSFFEDVVMQIGMMFDAMRTGAACCRMCMCCARVSSGVRKPQG
jgi:hypothetical protein